MKKQVMMVVALLLSTIAFAQMKNNGMRAQNVGQADKMKEVLSLSDEQYASVKAVDEKYADKFRQIRQEGSTSRDDFRKLQDERRKELHAILTTEQQQSWQEYRAEQRTGRRKSYDNRSRGGMEKMKVSLGLSDDQVKKLQDVNQKSAEQRRSLMADSSLTKEEKEARFKTLYSEHDAAVKGILSTEQYEKWKAERKSYRDNERGLNGRNQR